MSVDEGGVRPTGLHHVSLPVTDLERSTHFYREVIGLEPLARPDFPFDGAWFAVGADQQLHLIVHDRPTLRCGGVDGKDHHFALRVPSFERMREHLLAHGFREDADAEDPMLMRANPSPVAGFPQIFLLDPDRHVIEINTGADRSDPSDG